ncbi:MAG: helix-turn-helix domain-containing protein [Litorimonas sp.]
MKQASAIKCLSAISHDGRLSLMRHLIKAGPSGMSSGELAAAEKINASTASAQLLVLSNSGLVKASRNGKQMIYQAQYNQFQRLISFLTDDCCKGYLDD